LSRYYVSSLKPLHRSDDVWPALSKSLLALSINTGLLKLKYPRRETAKYYLKDHYTFYSKIYRADLAFNYAHLHQFIYIYLYNTQNYGRSKRERASF